MRIEEVENLLPLFEGAVETGRIKRKSLTNWLVKSLDIVFSICLSISLYSTDTSD